MLKLFFSVSSFLCVLYRSLIYCVTPIAMFSIFLNFFEVLCYILTVNTYRKCRKCKLESRRHGEEIEDTSVTRCLPRAIKLTPPKQPKNEKITSPISDCPRCSSVGPECDRSSIGESSRSITHAASVHGSSMRLESLKEEKEKLIRIEES